MKSSACNLSVTKPFSPNVAISLNVMRLREEKKLTQTGLAKLAKLSRKTINEVESGRKNRTSVRTLVQVAAALEVTPSDLLVVRNSGNSGSPNRANGKKKAAPPE